MAHELKCLIRPLSCRTPQGMNVLITTSTFPLSDDDGMPRFVFDLARAMSRQCRVTVLAPHSPGAQRRACIGDLTIRRFQYSWPARTQRLAYGYGMRQNMRISFAAKCQIPAYVAALGRAVRTCTRRERFDVINSHWLVPQGVAVSLARRRASPCVHVVTAHAGDLFLLKRMAMGKRIARFVANRSDMLLPVANHVRHGLQKLACDSIPWAIEPMGVDYNRFAAPPASGSTEMPFNGNYILFIGRLVEKKGLVYLMEAISLMPRGGKDVGLVVVGSGVLRGQLEKRADQLGIRDRVKFKGRLGHEEIVHYLHGCAVVALPSIVDSAGETEGMPTVLAEALSAGCKVVASRVAGVPDILMDGHNGWLAEPKNAADLAAKLTEALEYTGSDVQRNARERARELDWPLIAGRYLGHFDKLLTTSQRR